jgi:CO/xanthine dehydrogenase FAD-binding subunit
MSFSACDFVEPGTLKDAVARRAEGPCRVLAGGTDLGVEFRRQLPNDVTLLHVGLLPELCGISRGAGAITIGAAVTYGRILALGGASPEEVLLQDAARTIGSPGIMSMGTLGGNLATASPAADGALVLLALDAEIEVVASLGRRRIAVGEFIVGYRQTALRADELIERIQVPVLEGRRRGGAFRKYGNRDASILALVSAAAFLVFDDERRCTRARIALGAVAPTPVRAHAGEAVLEGGHCDPDALDEAANAALAAAAPIDDLRGSASYRCSILPVVVRDALDDAMRNASRARRAGA